ncbi:hypothetical protein ACOKM5_40725 [Streptomyces sp. BH097]|uniref:hypothetical protein n=1 Tax=unclassified Streptomyces TaxID=2593676 RepID=UPI003BB6FCD1
MTALAYGRGTGRLLSALIPDWLEIPLLIVFLAAIAVGWVASIRTLIVGFTPISRTGSVTTWGVVIKRPRA